MAIASLGGMAGDPAELSPIGPKPKGMDGTGGGLGGSSAQDGLGQINTGAQTVGSAIGQAAKALGTGAGGLSFNTQTGTFDQSMAMKKGGKVKAKGGDWHGFGKSSSGNIKNY
jgi:hypothetical protein